MKKHYHLYLENEEQAIIIRSLVNLKNKLNEEGRYTDPVDNMLIKVVNAPIKKIRVKY